MATNPVIVVIKNPLVIAAWRTFETAAIVALLTFCASLQTALVSPTGLSGYNWHVALSALALGVASGLVNGIVVLLNLLRQGATKS